MARRARSTRRARSPIWRLAREFLTSRGFVRNGANPNFDAPRPACGCFDGMPRVPPPGAFFAKQRPKVRSRCAPQLPEAVGPASRSPICSQVLAQFALAFGAHMRQVHAVEGLRLAMTEALHLGGESQTGQEPQPLRPATCSAARYCLDEFSQKPMAFVHRNPPPALGRAQGGGGWQSASSGACAFVSLQSGDLTARECNHPATQAGYRLNWVAGGRFSFRWSPHIELCCQPKTAPTISRPNSSQGQESCREQLANWLRYGRMSAEISIIGVILVQLAILLGMETSPERSISGAGPLIPHRALPICLGAFSWWKWR